MKLHFLGANRQVTGSRYCLEVGSDKVLVDCGMFQERPYLDRNWAISPIPPSEISALLLTHAHLDHCGLIPRLAAEGFSGPIYATAPTAALAEVILRDSAEIQAEDVAYKKRRHAKEGRRGRHPEIPLYTETQVEKALRLFRAVEYQQPVQLGNQISVTFHDAGHILGSAMLEVSVGLPDHQTRLVFSGDIGQWGKPLIRDPSLFDQADYVVMESTYADRNHEDAGDIESQLCRIINDTVRRGGNVLIPTFAVERAQELMYHIGRLVHDDRIPDMQIFLDSPMAVDVTKIFLRFREYFDEETWARSAAREPPLRFPGLRLVRSVEDSKAINNIKQPCIIMASSGMCTAGRIKHHLRRNLGRPEATVLFVGYQGRGTLGRQILDGKREVRIHGRLRRVKAEVAQIYGFSGHADRRALLRWLTHIQRPKEIFLTHGEEDAAMDLANYIRDKLQRSVTVPEYQATVTLQDA